MAETLHLDAIDYFVTRPARITSLQSPFGVVRVTRDQLHRVTRGCKTLREAGRVRGVARWLRGVVQTENG